MKPNNNIKTETVRTRKNDSGRRSRVISLAAAALICLAPYAQGQPAAAVSAISAKYASMGGATGGLGPATSSITGTADGAWYQKYNYGAIYWTAATSAHEVHGQILTKYLAIGGPTGLGYPTTDETGGTYDATIRYNHFQRGTIGWRSSLGAREVHGDIWGKYISLGGPDGFLGAPLTDETGTPDSIGRYNHFDGGSIYWTIKTGAHEVHGLIRDRWSYLGWERSFLGYPISDQQSTPNLSNNGAQGSFNSFQHGRIYWTPSSGAVEVQDLAEVWEYRQKKDFLASTTGPRPVLTIIYDTHTKPQEVDPACQDVPRCTTVMPAPTVADIQDVLFGTRPNEPPRDPSLPVQNADDFYRENSGPSSSSAPSGRMRLLNAGIFKIDAPLLKQGKHYWDASIHQYTHNDGWLNGHQERAANAITLAYTQMGFNFAAYDTNHDGKLTSDELAIIVVCAGEGDWGDAVTVYGGNTVIYQYGSPSGTYTFDLTVDGVTIRNPNHTDIVEWFTHPAAVKPISLGLPTHELGHLLIGIPDLYDTYWKYDAGSFSRMSGHSADFTTHFDPFVKLKSKWLDFAVIAGTGQYTYTLRNIEQFGEALVLYEPSLGRKEYFILEYRRPGTSYDAGRGGAGGGLPNAGLAVWHIVEDQTRQNVLIDRLNLPTAQRTQLNNWYRRGVLLQRSDDGRVMDDAHALYTNPSGGFYLTWGDGSGPGFRVELLSIGLGTANPPSAITLSITR